MTQNEIIKEAKKRLPEPETISNQYYVIPILTNAKFPSVDVFKLVEFEKISDKGILSWKFKSIA